MIDATVFREYLTTLAVPTINLPIILFLEKRRDGGETFVVERGPGRSWFQFSKYAGVVRIVKVIDRVGCAAGK